MDRLIRLWRGSLSHQVNNLELSLPPETLLYLQTILRLSEEKLFNHSLFGSGAEPPIRIHLILGGKRFVQKVPVIPLLNKPGFQGLVYSGRSRRSPTRGHFDSCQTEFMNALLEVGKNLDGLRREYRRMSDESSSVMKISPPVCPSSETIVLHAFAFLDPATHTEDRQVSCSKENSCPLGHILISHNRISSININ